MVVGARPLAFDLETGLRRAVAIAEVSAGKRRVALLWKHLHTNRGFLISRCVSVAVGEAAGEPVDRFYDGVDGHVKLVSLDAVGDDNLHANDTVGAHQLNVAAGGDSAVGG